MSRLRVMIISTNADEAGAPRHVESLAVELRSEIEYLCVFGEDGPVARRLQESDVKVAVVKQMRTSISPLKDVRSFLRIWRLVRDFRPDIIHCHSAKAGMLGRLAALATGIPWIYTVHGWGWRGMSWPKSFVIRSIEFLLGLAPNGRFIFVAQDVLKAATQLGRSVVGRGVVIYNGVGDKFRAPLGVSDTLRIVMPARVSAAKDHETMLRAFENFHNRRAELILCGAGTDTIPFRNFVQEICPNKFKDISLLGEISNIDELFASCHVVALISNFEALPMSLIEGMSAERVVIGTEVGGVPEIIESGVNGLLVEKNSAQSLLCALNYVENEVDRMNLAKAARIKYLEKFSLESMAQQTLQIYINMAVRS